MASTTSNLCPIDPAKAAKYPVILSPALHQEDENIAKQHAAIQFNHKPELFNSPFETCVTPSSSRIDGYNLAIKADDNGSNYLYSGTQQTSESYALIYDSIKQSFTLDRISSDFTFNLRSTPTIKSSKALASTYPHLDTGISDPESSSDDPEETELDTSGANPSNPYDYRHFLNRRQTSSPVSPDLPALTSGSPLYKPAPSPKPAGSRPIRPLHRRASSSTSREETDADNEESDDGGLTIEFDPDVKKRRFQGNISYDKSNGPISFSYAASSASPAAIVQQNSESDEDEDVEVMHLEANGVQTVQEDEDRDRDEDDDEGDEDEDEDDIEIEGNAESTIHIHDDDDDDDGSLAAELEQAMESQADEEVNGTMHGMESGVGTTLGLGIAGIGPGAQRTNIRDDSSSESEEE